MDELLIDWRAEGIGRDQLELWAIGYDTDAETVATFAGDSEAACGIDANGTTFSLLNAKQDDIFVIDGNQEVVFWMSLVDGDLTEADRREELAEAVRGAL